MSGGNSEFIFVHRSSEVIFSKMCFINYYKMLYMRFFYILTNVYDTATTMTCVNDLPAVDVNNHIINERYQHTHTCHYVTQIVPVFVHTDDKTYNCSASAEYRC